MNEIGIWFLVLSLFLPRFTLFFWWITGNLPYNTTPLIADVACSIFLPRVLTLVYIYQNQEFSPWFWIHLVALFIAWGYNILHAQENWEKMQKMVND